MEVEQIVGEAKVEGKAEGEVIAEPSGDAVVPVSSGNTPFFSLESGHLCSHTISLLNGFPFFSKADPLDQTSVYQISQPDPLCSFGFVSSTDESSEREEVRVALKEEYEVDGPQLLVEVGRYQHWQRRR